MYQEVNTYLKQPVKSELSEGVTGGGGVGGTFFLFCFFFVVESLPCWDTRGGESILCRLYEG